MSNEKGLHGLTNIGNTCYGNSVLQSLRHQRDLCIFFLEDKHKEILDFKKSTEKTRLLESYVELLKHFWMKPSSNTLQTREFWGSMIPAAQKAGFEQFGMPLAHDAHEFLVFLLDQMHEALAEEVTMKIKESVGSHTREALSFWQKTFEKQYSPLVELLFSLQRRAVRCESCEKESVSWETLNILKASVPKYSDHPLTLLQLLEKEAHPESIEEYSCDHCKPTRTKATIQNKLWRLGNWVIVVLKRNENNGRKINSPVEIPLETSFTPLFHDLTVEPSRTNTYSLFATIHHHGPSGGGHYTSQAQHPVSKKWFMYDDERVYECREGPELGPSTYIVMYRAL